MQVFKKSFYSVQSIFYNQTVLWRGESLLQMWSSLSGETITAQTTGPDAGNAGVSKAASALTELSVGEGRRTSI